MASIINLAHLKPDTRAAASDFMRWLQMATEGAAYHGRYEVIVAAGEVQVMHEVWTKKPKEMPAA